MTFWLTVLALTVAAVIIGFRPLFRSGAGALDRAEDHEHDMAVYRHQLQEIDAELVRGVLSDNEAQQARNEVSRRILAVQDRLDASAPEAGSTGAKRAGSGLVLALFAFVFVPGLTFIIYAGIGSPGYEAQPLAARIQAINEAETARSETRAQMLQLVGRAEDHLRNNPDDGRGWDVLAPIYFQLGDIGKSETAYRNAIRLLGETPARLSGLGEVMVTGAGGMVTASAAELFEQALAEDSSDARALFFSGLGSVQLGNADAARARWTELQADTQADPAWRTIAQDSLARLNQAEEANPMAGRPPALDDDAVSQAQQLADEEQSELIQSMVASLDERLRTDPDDLEGWKRLIRARIVLDQSDGLRDAMVRAHGVYSDRPEDLANLQAFAETLGLNVEDYWQ